MMMMHPAMPAMGAQIDRAGRAAVSTALVATFNGDTDAKNARKDEYNGAAPDAWAGFAGDIAGSLAIYDALDTVCGNQALYGAGFVEGDETSNYAVFAGALVDDRLYVDTSDTVTSCAVYLAVEAQATGLLENTDCGGRRPADDTIDPTLSLMAVGAVGGVGDGIDADNVMHPAEFPWLAAPVAAQ
jgi:hypothetical protein